MPDPARGERLNIGVLLWAPHHYVVRVDDDALNRIVGEHPHLERESLYYVSSAIRERLAGDGLVDERVNRVLSSQSGFPADLTEARYVAVTDLSPETLDEKVDNLIERVVRPVKRVGGGGGFDPRRHLMQRLKPLVKTGKVEEHWTFSTSGTGLRRAVDFYANSAVNTALDVLRLNVKRADDIRNRADAEAFKVYDIRRENDIRYVVYCDLPLDRSLEKPADEAQKVLKSTGAAVVTTAEAAEAAMRGHNGE